jgi:hypothetical protein
VKFVTYVLEASLFYFTTFSLDATALSSRNRLVAVSTGVTPFLSFHSFITHESWTPLLTAHIDSTS